MPGEGGTPGADRVAARAVDLAPGVEQSSVVEQALGSLDGVAEAAAVVVDVGAVGRRLVAYVASRADPAPTGWELRRDLALVVPPAMVPTTIVVLDALPRDARGAVDHDALPPAPGLAPWREPTRAERDLIAVFAQVLGQDVIGPDDDFFALGGDSLSAIELVSAIGDRFGVDANLSLLLEAPTPALLAPRLGTRRTRHESVLVPLQTKGTGVPFVCVAGGGAPALSLRALAGAMGRFGRHARPFVAVQARGLEERAWPDRTVAAMAKRTARAVQAELDGPVLLGGYSSGGQVAFEAARRLVAAGVDVRGVVLIDAPVTWGTPGGTASRAWRQMTSAEPAHPTGDGSSSTRAPTAVTRVAGTARAGRRHVARRARLATAGVVPRAGLAQYELFFDLHRECSLRYRPSGAFAGPAVVLRFTGPDRIVPDAPDDLGWSAWVTGPVRVVELPGKHLEMLRPPGVAKVGAALRTALAELDPS